MNVDVVVIGAGPGGRLVAEGAVGAGCSTMLVEARLVGGLCPFWACMPSKALLRPGQIRRTAELVPGVTAPELTADEVLAWRDDIIRGLDDSKRVEDLTAKGIEVVRGRARLEGERRLRVERNGVGALEVEVGELVVIATGTVPDAPPIDGLESVSHWTTDDATTAGDLPDSLIVLGGGPVGCELAQAYARLGSSVVLVESERAILPGFHEVAAESVQRALEADGVEVKVAETVERLEHDGDGVVAHPAGDTSALRAARLLVATGRTPATAGLGLELVGAEIGDDGVLQVDEYLRVKGVEGDWLVAVGDINGRMPTTHHAHYQAGLIVDRLHGRPAEAASSDRKAATQVVFTDPAVAVVGPTLERAQERFDDARERRVSLGGTAAAAAHGEADDSGVAVFVLAEDRVLGATIVGPQAAEMLHAATIAVVGEVPLRTLVHAVPAFPTFAQVWELLLDPAGRAERRY